MDGGGPGVIDLTTPRCPACDEPLQVKWRHGRRYLHCWCEASQGDAPAPAAARCHLCSAEMDRRLGTLGRWTGRWLWFCRVHVVPNATVKAPPGPADPRTLHHREPAMGDGFAKRGL